MPDTVDYQGLEGDALTQMCMPGMATRLKSQGWQCDQSHGGTVDPSRRPLTCVVSPKAPVTSGKAAIDVATPRVLTRIATVKKAMYSICEQARAGARYCRVAHACHLSSHGRELLCSTCNVRMRY